MIVVFGAIMYFLMIRPQQKRMQQHQEMISAIEPGARVLLTSGIYATVLHAGERQFIIELAPGVEVTIAKGHVSRVVSQDEEEFEFDDSAAVDPADEPRGHLATDDELRAMFEEPSAEEPEGETGPDAPSDDDSTNR